MEIDVPALYRAALTSLPVPEWPWLRWLLDRAAVFIQRSLFDADGRYYWVTFFEALAVLAIAYALRPDWRARWGGGFLRFCFPPGYFTHRSTVTDLQLNVVNFLLTPSINLFWRFSAAFFTAQFLAGLVWAFGPGPQALSWNWGTILAATLLYAVLSDFGYWVWHYIAHMVPGFWYFHKVHHSAEVLTPLVAGRVHPVEAILVPMFRNAAVALGMAPTLYFFVAEAPVWTLFGMGIVASLFAIAGDQLFHAHVPVSWGPWLNRVFISPATHQLHHSVERRHWDKNMGAFFAVWDWMFGTLYLPDSRQQIVYGVRDDQPQPHPGLITAYGLPFVEVARGLARPMSLLHRRDVDVSPPPRTD